MRVPVAHLRVVEHFLARKAVQRNGLLLLREELQRLQVPVHHSTHPHPQTLARHGLILLQQNRRNRTQRVAAHHVLVNPDPAVIRQLQRILQRRAALLHLLLEQVEGTRVVQRLTHRRLVRVGELELGLHFLGQVVHALAQRQCGLGLGILVPANGDGVVQDAKLAFIGDRLRDRQQGVHHLVDLVATGEMIVKRGEERGSEANHVFSVRAERGELREREDGRRTSFTMGAQSAVFFMCRSTFTNSMRSRIRSSASPRESTFFVISLINAFTSLGLLER